MPKTLGGSLFVRNAIKFGYCVIEALESLYALCDQVSILECGSDDGTKKLIQDWVASKPARAHIIANYDHPWAIGKEWSRLAILADIARSYLTTDWHFMLQADEVLHESSFPEIRRLIECGPNGYFLRRLNLFRGPDTHVRIDLKGKGKPCGDVVCRLARTPYRVVGDAESIGVDHGVSDEHVDKLVIFHYGYVREGAKHIAKAIDMQSWFFGPHGTPDARIVKMRDEGNKFRPEVFFSPEDVCPIPIPHPIFARDLAEKLRAEACQ